MLGIVLLTLGTMLAIITLINYFQVTSDFNAIETNNRQNLINKNWKDLTEDEFKILKATFPVQWFSMISASFLLIIVGSLLTAKEK